MFPRLLYKHSPHTAIHPGSRDPFIRAMSPGRQASGTQFTCFTSTKVQILTPSLHPGTATSPRGVPGMVSDTCGYRAYCGGEAGGGMHMYQVTTFKETLHQLPGGSGRGPHPQSVTPFPLPPPFLDPSPLSPQGPTLPIDVPSDVISNNFDLWMQEVYTQSHTHTHINTHTQVDTHPQTHP